MTYKNMRVQEAAKTRILLKRYPLLFSANIYLYGILSITERILEGIDPSGVVKPFLPMFEMSDELAEQLFKVFFEDCDSEITHPTSIESVIFEWSNEILTHLKNTSLSINPSLTRYCFVTLWWQSILTEYSHLVKGHLYAPVPRQSQISRKRRKLNRVIKETIDQFYNRQDIHFFESNKLRAEVQRLIKTLTLDWKKEVQILAKDFKNSV